MDRGTSSPFLALLAVALAVALLAYVASSPTSTSSSVPPSAPDAQTSSAPDAQTSSAPDAQTSSASSTPPSSASAPPSSASTPPSSAPPSSASAPPSSDSSAPPSSDSSSAPAGVLVATALSSAPTPRVTSARPTPAPTTFPPALPTGPVYPFSFSEPQVSRAPRPEAPVVKPESFGAVGDARANDLPALRKATAQAVATKGTLTLSAGRSYFVGDDPATFYVFDLVNADTLDVEGNGATIVLSADMEPMRLVGCRNVAFRNLTFRAVAPVTIQGTLQNVTTSGAALSADLVLDADSDRLLAQQALADPTLTNSREHMCFVFDPKTMRSMGMYSFGSSTQVANGGLSAKDPARGVYALTMFTKDKSTKHIVKPGYKVATGRLAGFKKTKQDLSWRAAKKQPRSSGTARMGTYLIRCDGLFFSNVAMSGCSSVRAETCGTVIFDKVDMAPPDDRMLGGCCHWHFGNIGPIVIKNSYVRGNADDTINMVARPAVVLKRMDASNRTFMMGFNPHVFAPGDRVVFTADVAGQTILKYLGPGSVTYPNSGGAAVPGIVLASAGPDWIGEGVVQTAQTKHYDPDPNDPNHWNNEAWVVTFTRALDFLAPYTDVELQVQVRGLNLACAHGNGVFVHDCHLCSIIMAPIDGTGVNAVVRNNLIESHVSPEANMGCGGFVLGNGFNGPGPCNLTIQDCKVVGVAGAFVTGGVRGNCQWWNRNIRIVGNTFTSSAPMGTAVSLRGFENVVVENNSIEVAGDKLYAAVAAGADNVAYGTRNVRIANNRISAPSAAIQTRAAVLVSQPCASNDIAADNAFALPPDSAPVKSFKASPALPVLPSPAISKFAGLTPPPEPTPKKK